MDFVYDLVGYAFVPAIYQLRHSWTGNSASVCKLRDGDLGGIHIMFEAIYQIHRGGGVELVIVNWKYVDFRIF